ncbi:hypothetical protein DSUL_20004 [Desulfovibrionales bacterium]
MINSLNTVTIQIAKNIGIWRMIRQAQALGIMDYLPEYLSVALGSQVISLQNFCGSLRFIRP